MRALLLIPAIIVFGASTGCSNANTAEQPTALTADLISGHSVSGMQWGPVPSVLPPGAQIAVLQGNPFGTGVYTLRLTVTDTGGNTAVATRTVTVTADVKIGNFKFSETDLVIPLSGIPLHQQRELISSLADLGYTDVWSAESGGADAFTPLTLAAAWAPTLRLGTAIVPAFTRGAPTIAQSAAALADAAPGRFALGIGTSSDVIVQRWNGIPFDKPFQRVRDVVRFLRVACRAGPPSPQLPNEAGRG